MNCKPGDLVVIASTAGRTGVQRRIVEALLGMPVRVVTPYSLEGEPAWKIEREINVLIGPVPAAIVGIADAVLRPLRDRDGEDEMLRIVGKPVTEAA